MRGNRADFFPTEGECGQYPREAARFKLIGPAEMAALGLERAWYEHAPMVEPIEALRVDIAGIMTETARA